MPDPKLRDMLLAKVDELTASVASQLEEVPLLELHGRPDRRGIILGHAGDPARFLTPERFASYNGTAPIEASSGHRKRHRLNPRGNRKLNHALHLAAVRVGAHLRRLFGQGRSAGTGPRVGIDHARRLLPLVAGRRRPHPRRCRPVARTG